MPHASPSMSTDTEAATHIHRLCVQPQAHDPDVLRQVLFDIMAKAGHSHLLLELEDYATDKGSEVDDIDTMPMSPTRRVIIEAAQKMQPEPQGPMAEELLNPMRTKSVPPRRRQPSNLLPLRAVCCQCLAGRWMPVAT